MATPRLTIRNLTSTPIELKVVERYAAPNQQPDNAGNGIANITKNFTSLLSNNTTSSPTAPQLAEHAESFTTQNVSIRINEFDTNVTDIANEHPKKEILRLTFENEGQRYRLDAAVASTKSLVLKPLSQNPKFEYTAVYLPDHSFLSIFSSAKLESWMDKLKDETPLSALSLPGTHNSPAHYTALPSVRCQAVSVREQLDNGVRFLDIRVQPEDANDVNKDGLILVHSAFPISLTGNKYFRDLVKEIRAFLDAHPSETVIISVKREGVGKATDQHLSKILRRHYAGDVQKWYTAPRIPNLGEARGKIVLLRRFALDPDVKKNNWDGRGWGIDGSSWPDNCADGHCGSGQIRVQDFYEVEETKNIDTKVSYAQAQLARAAAAICPLPGDANVNTQGPKQPFYINFLSASNFWKAGLWPEKIAAKINPQMIDFLCREHNTKPAEQEVKMHVGDGSTGIVVCDWVGANGDWNLVRCIVGMNAKLELREKNLPA